MASRVKDRVTDYGKRLEREFQRLKRKPYVKVGIQSQDFSEAKVADPASTETTAATLGEIAVFHEFGLGVPERSFLRATYDNQWRAWKRLTDSLKAKILIGDESAVKALAVIGQRIEADIKMAIRNRIPPPLSPRTIRRKGSSVPLIDTGQLINSIRYVVVNASSNKQKDVQ